mmetsp:Transcript_1368/g.2490  ORF Transcript_1368/g.2490 Transcript_1368/m.2490 type:complete len:313 (+) Transcript_1368:1878-2816(+)
MRTIHRRSPVTYVLLFLSGADLPHFMEERPDINLALTSESCAAIRKVVTTAAVLISYRSALAKSPTRFPISSYLHTGPVRAPHSNPLPSVVAVKSCTTSQYGSHLASRARTSSSVASSIRVPLPGSSLVSIVTATLGRGCRLAEYFCRCVSAWAVIVLYCAGQPAVCLCRGLDGTSGGEAAAVEADAAAELPSPLVMTESPPPPFTAPSVSSLGVGRGRDFLPVGGGVGGPSNTITSSSLSSSCCAEATVESNCPILASFLCCYDYPEYCQRDECLPIHLREGEWHRMEQPKHATCQGYLLRPILHRTGRDG